MKLPPLTSFRVFNVAAQADSFVQAAEQLHVTHGAVSRQIKQLEDALGTALFERRNRAVFLTPVGRLLLTTTQSVFEQLEGTVYRIRQQTNQSVIVLSCEPTIAMKWLIPRLPAFEDAHPDIQLHLSAAGGPIDFQKSGVDVALRRNDFNWGSEIHSLKISDEWVGPVCRADRQGFLRANPVLLHTRSRPLAWKNWESAGGAPIKKGKRVDYEHFYLCIQAAMAGLGMAMASYFMVQDELRAQQLVAPHGFKRDRSAYYLLSPDPITPESKLARLANWVLGEMQACSSQIGSKAG
ncbi:MULTISPECIES: LysR substrate-binding domain-containing protein [Paraburkholderia]|uniref:Transcriptional regulator, LysR family n=1 Tax=Paraburkholderia megapolitana TaxID=420953 RepID=A0A1I3RQC9_9BURK|nr:MULTISPECIES: LysR substrate-binding domain-containing protein [Paraburkholderia]MCX4165277.1 LysR substrate-binding domain-containing protein [Paraburkholderia megapolitana]MDN7160769.1 LysR substrate-binding domain-containing protein [Paraburkholderia sp. CHISQ3]MDQ6497816.1 LysR substrate-binding domain-containing protein [Paraburkholderia megapolitana]QDQ83980.1 LysR family transcriptional regulator [Paraburkholderia megapolitana]SFJ48082.1 transcriptional regulator, LysR family [Parabu